jgi:outer membrane immunogenic protein
MRTKWIALTSAALLLPPAAAQAQQANPAYNWSGFYLGLNAGSAWGRFETTTTPAGNYLIPPDYALVAAAGTGSMSGSGFTGGIQAGYNWQTSNIVYGLEVDFGAFSIDAKRQVTGSFPGGFLAGQFTITNSADADWLFTARGRYGWVFSNVLAYVTGGLAVTQITTANTYSDTGFGFTANGNASATRLGWTLGGGLEWALGKNWTIKTEYLYLDFGKVDATGSINPGGWAYTQAINTSVDLTAHIARAGVNFKF